MATVTFDMATRMFPGATRPAVDRLDLNIEDGEFLVLVGPSGCGKSTSLRMLAGLEFVNGGKIFIGDRDVTRLAPKERDIAMVFQNYALYPHMTVEQNLGFGLKLQHVSKQERQDRVLEAATILGLQDMMTRKPSELSGGQRQRVAIGRAMVREPKAFLMDEPLSNLDAKLRIHMRAELQRLHDRLKTTTVYVTHDQVEAMTLGDRVAVLRDGVLQQVDTPQNLYTHPANLFVAAFMGAPPMNLVEATIDGGTLRFGGFSIPAANGALAGYGQDTVIVGIRPADMEDADVRPDDGPTISVRADVTEELGSEVNILFRVDAPPVAADVIMAATDEEGEELLLLADDTPGVMFCARVDARTKVQPGGDVRLTLDPSRFHYFDPATGLAVGAAA